MERFSKSVTVWSSPIENFLETLLFSFTRVISKKFDHHPIFSIKKTNKVNNQTKIFKCLIADDRLNNTPQIQTFEKMRDVYENDNKKIMWINIPSGLYAYTILTYFQGLVDYCVWHINLWLWFIDSKYLGQMEPIACNCQFCRKIHSCLANSIPGGHNMSWNEGQDGSIQFHWNIPSDSRSRQFISELNRWTVTIIYYVW